MVYIKLTYSTFTSVSNWILWISPSRMVCAACCRAGSFNGLVSWWDDAIVHGIYMWKCAFMCVRSRVRFTPFNYYCIKVFRLICSFRIYFVKVFSYKRHVLTIIITHTHTHIQGKQQKTERGKCSCAFLHGWWCISNEMEQENSSTTKSRSFVMCTDSDDSKKNGEDFS